jgi:hypothetical protein
MMTKQQLKSLFHTAHYHKYSELVVAHAILWIQSQECESIEGKRILLSAAHKLLDQMITGAHNE